jgi:hypothetical protein
MAARCLLARKLEDQLPIDIDRRRIPARADQLEFRCDEAREVAQDREPEFFEFCLHRVGVARAV